MFSIWSQSMIHILLSLVLLKSCFGNLLDEHLDDDKHPNHWEASGKRGLSESEAPKGAGLMTKSLADTGDYISTIIFTDVPSFSDSTDVGDVSGGTDNFNILYSKVEFYSLSSAYALSYRINLDENTVQLLLNLNTAQIKGSYSVPTSSARNPGSQLFELNLYSNLIYTYNIAFQFKNKKVTFGKTDNQQLLFSKVIGKYTNPPSALVFDLKNYLDPKLLETIVSKIYNEVSQKVSLEDVGFQIKNEIIFRNRKEVAGRLQKSVSDSFEDIRRNLFTVRYQDITNFVRFIHNFEVRVPTFYFRDVNEFKMSESRVSFVGDDVHAKMKFLISTPLVIFDIVYRDRFDNRSQNKTLKAEYTLLDYLFGGELVARPDAGTVELENVIFATAGLKLAESQGKYGDERDAIVEKLAPYLQAYFNMNAYHPYRIYFEGLITEGKIVHQVFK